MGTIGEGATRQDLIKVDARLPKTWVVQHDKGGPGKSLHQVEITHRFDAGAWAELQAEFGTGWVPTLAESLKGVVSPLETFRGLMTGCK